MCRPDCGVSGQWSAGVQKLHVLASAARLHKGHQHPPAFPPHQHAARPPDLQGPERSHCHTQGEAHTLQTHTGVSCWETLVVKPNSQLCTTCILASFLLTQTHWSAPSCSHVRPCQGLRSDLSVHSHHDNNFGRETVRTGLDSSRRLQVYNMVPTAG